jgi:hypothetical protein
MVGRWAPGDRAGQIATSRIVKGIVRRIERIGFPCRFGERLVHHVDPVVDNQPQKAGPQGTEEPLPWILAIPQDKAELAELTGRLQSSPVFTVLTQQRRGQIGRLEMLREAEQPRQYHVGGRG